MSRHLYRNYVLSTDFLIDFGLLILSIFLFILSSDYPDMARTFPHLVLMMIVVVTLLDMLKMIRKGQGERLSEKKIEEVGGAGQARKLKVFYMAALMFVFFFFMVFFGYVLGTFLFLLVSGWTLGYRRVGRLLLSSVSITVFVYLIFGVIMNSLLPRGLIFSITGG